MGLFDFFFPEQAQAERLRELVDQQRRILRKTRTEARTSFQSKTSTDQLQKQVETLRNDLGYVTLLLGALVDQLDAKGTLTRADLRAAVEAIDLVDDVEDGKLDIEALKHAVSGKDEEQAAGG